MRSEIGWERFDVPGGQSFVSSFVLFTVSFITSSSLRCHSVSDLFGTFGSQMSTTYNFPCSRAHRQNTPKEPVSRQNPSLYSAVKLSLFPLNTGLQPVIWPGHNVAVNSLMLYYYYFFFFFFFLELQESRQSDNWEVKPRGCSWLAWRHCRSASRVIYNILSSLDYYKNHI